MGEQQRNELASALREHERQVEELSRTLARIETAAPSSEGVRQQVVYLTAQVMKHRISMALLASRLREAPALLQ